MAKHRKQIQRHPSVFESGDPRRAVRLPNMEKNKPLPYCNEAVQSPTLSSFIPATMSYDASSGVDNMHRLMEKQPTKKHTSAFLFSPAFLRSCAWLLCSARLCSEPSERSTEKSCGEGALLFYLFSPETLT